MRTVQTHRLDATLPTTVSKPLTTASTMTLFGIPAKTYTANVVVDTEPEAGVDKGQKKKRLAVLSFSSDGG
jgi:hypothetical protein